MGELYKSSNPLKEDPRIIRNVYIFLTSLVIIVGCPKSAGFCLYIPSEKITRRALAPLVILLLLT